MYSIRTRKKISNIPRSSFKIAKKRKNLEQKNLNQKWKLSGKESEIEDALLE